MAVKRTPYMPIGVFESKQIVDSLGFSGEEVVTKTKSNDADFTDSEGYSPIIDLLLEGWGLEKYVPLFEIEDIGLDTLMELDEKDLMNLGITDAEDQKKILSHLKDFHPEKDNRPKLKILDSIEDDLKMARNVLRHIVQLNAHASYIQFLLGKNQLEDYIISTHETALKIMKLVCNKAQMQTKRISDILFDGNFTGQSNLIASVLEVNEIRIIESKKKKLMETKVKKKLRKKALLFTVLSAICLVFTTISFRKSLN